MSNTYLLLSAFILASHLVAGEARWPQFRGPDGAGVADDQKPPTHFSPSSNVVWRTELPFGQSSPCIWGDKIFLTAQQDDRLTTLCLRRRDGVVLWRKDAPVEKVEKFNTGYRGSAAASTPVTDGQRLYVYFGSFGVLCYGLDGDELWRAPLPVPVTFDDYGTGASPVLADGLIVLNRDEKRSPHLLALAADTGKLVWRKDRLMSNTWCTPTVWQHDDVKEIVVPASSRVVGYDLKTGEERWQVTGTSLGVVSTPVAGEGLLFAATFVMMDATSFQPFETLLPLLDKDGDGQLSQAEADGAPSLKRVFDGLDRNGDHQVSRDEYDGLYAMVKRSQNKLVAIRPGGKGDITATHVAWSQTRALPYVTSPLCYRGRLYLIKSNGGMVSCLEAQTGRFVYTEERLGEGDLYYSSPVAADGRIYAGSGNGVMVVFEAGDNFRVLARNKIGDHLGATPAVVDNTLYVRTTTDLFAFAETDRGR